MKTKISFHLIIFLLLSVVFALYGILWQQSKLIVLYWGFELIFLLALLLFGIVLRTKYNSQVSSINHNAANIEQVHKKLSNFNSLLRSIKDLTDELSKINSMDQLIGILANVKERFAFDVFYFWIDSDKKEENFRINNQSQAQIEKIAPMLLTALQQNRKSLLLQNSDNDELAYLLKEMNLSSLAVHPLIEEQKVLGFFLAGNKNSPISQDQFQLLGSIGKAIIGALAKDELRRMEEYDSNILHSLSGITNSTVARIKLFQETQERLEKKTRELRRLIKELARTHLMTLKNVRMSIVSRNSLFIVKEMNALFLDLSSKVNQLGEFFHFLFLLQQKEISSHKYNSNLNQRFADIEFTFEKCMVELRKCIRISGGINNHSTNKLLLTKYSIENLIEVAQNALELIPHDIWKNIRVVFTPNPELKWKINRGQLERAFCSLFQNAIESMEGEGILEVYGSIMPNGLSITVKDSGRGISDTIKDKIFNPFFTTKQGRTGIGLALVSDIVRKFGGEIILSPHFSSGASFIINFYNDFASE